MDDGAYSFHLVRFWVYNIYLNIMYYDLQGATDTEPWTIYSYDFTSVIDTD